jgi:serine/threonine-protein kinase RsbT
MNGILPPVQTSTTTGGLFLDETLIPVRCDLDIVEARQRGRDLARSLGFSAGEQVLIATSISELARNILTYAKEGEIILQVAERRGAAGVVIIARDRGPGIKDTRLALEEGYSTSRSLGLGLPGVKRVMDEFEIVSEVGEGTTITVKKWTSWQDPSWGRRRQRGS